MSSIASLPENRRLEALRRIVGSPENQANLQSDWSLFRARPEQRPPTDPDWLVWLLLAGRGFGKTRTGAETVRMEIESGRARRVALVAPTAADVRNVMVEGQSGLLSIGDPLYRPRYEPSKRRLTWFNGGIAECYSADEPDRLRGPQHDFAWLRIRF